MIRTIALAYSGGLDTSIIVPWLKERYGARVICIAADVGQGSELDGVRAKAIASGAMPAAVASSTPANWAVKRTHNGGARLRAPSSLAAAVVCRLPQR